jgi:hypothetical protein
LDSQGQPTQLVIESRRAAKFISPIPKPRKQKGKLKQTELDLRTDGQLSSADQNYETCGVITELRWEIQRPRRSLRNRTPSAVCCLNSRPRSSACEWGSPGVRIFGGPWILN